MPKIKVKRVPIEIKGKKYMVNVSIDDLGKKKKSKHKKIYYKGRKPFRV